MGWFVAWEKTGVAFELLTDKPYGDDRVEASRPFMFYSPRHVRIQRGRCGTLVFNDKKEESGPVAWICVDTAQTTTCG